MNLSTNPTSSLFRHASHGWIHHPSVGWCLLFRWFGAAPGGSTRTAKSAEHFPTREDSGDTFHSRKPSPSSVCLKMNTMDSISEYHETDHDILLLQNHSRVPTRVEILMSQPTSLLRDVPSRSQCPEKPYVLSLSPGMSTVGPGTALPPLYPLDQQVHLPSVHGWLDLRSEASSPAGRLPIFSTRAKAGWTRPVRDTVVALWLGGGSTATAKSPPRARSLKR